jgi:Ca2+-binding RTX toxin-like protein
MPAGEHELHGDLDHYQETLVGSSENDLLYSSSSYDNIQGGDILDGGQGDDQLHGSSGSDRVIFRAGDGADTFIGQGGADIVELRGLQLNGAGTRLDVSGDDLIVGFGTGTQLTLEGWKSNPQQNLVVVQEQGGPMYSSDQVNALVKGFIGTSVGEELTGNSLDNDIIGLGGVDTLYGLDGNDNLTGGSDNDIDHLYGGMGFDTYNVSNNDVINDSDASGQVFLDGALLTGGAFVDTGPGGVQHYRSADNSTDYFFDLNAQTLQ